MLNWKEGFLQSNSLECSSVKMYIDEVSVFLLFLENLGEWNDGPEIVFF